MTTTSIVRQSHFLPDLPDWFEMFVPGPWLRRPPMAQGIRIEDFEEDGHYVIKAELPGIEPEKDLEVTVGDGILYLRAGRTERAGDKRHSEFRYGSFTRTVRLPEGAKTTGIKADYGDGILTVTIPVGEAKKPVHKIAVTRR